MDSSDLASPPLRLADAEALLARRRAALRDRQALAEDRWRRYREAAARRIGVSERSRLEQRLDRLLARGRWPGRTLQIARSGLWLPRLAEAPVWGGGATVSLPRYARAGPDPQMRPKALFDQAWYLEKNPDLMGSQWPPLAHYLVLGDPQNRSPHPLFDARDYRSRHAVKIAASRQSALQHFMFTGAVEGYDPHPLFDLRWYVGRCDEVAESGENPLIHYLRIGWRQGLDPHPLFAGDWYLENNPDAAAAGSAPLLHYVLIGAAAGRDPHPLFDGAWYAARRRDVAGSGYDPLSHFVRIGARQRSNPGPHFDVAYYLEQQVQLTETAANPLIHYVTEGAFAGAWPAADFDEVGYLAEHPEAADTGWSGLEHRLRTHAARPQRSAEPVRWVSAEALFEQLRANGRARDPAAYNLAAYEALAADLRALSPEASELESRNAGDEVRVVAFHRPDLAGGEVWGDVVRALPNYRGHYQPHLPADLGYYPALDPAVLERQAELAARYGVAGFCHPFRRAAPPEPVLSAGPADFGFCLMLGEDAQVDPDLSGLAADLAPFLAAPRALRVHGAALLVVAASPQAPDDAEWTDGLRRAVRDAGLGELFLVRCAEFAFAAGPDPAEQGFDAAVDFAEAPEVAPIPPPGPVVNHRHQGMVRDYRDLARQALAAAGPGRLPAVAAGFDDAPCGQDQASVYHHASPGAFQAWLEAALAQARARRTGEARLVFVHAWNGWMQGSHLEPDVRFGHGWLEAVRNALDANLLERP